MGILTTSKGRTSGQKSGMGFLLVFFPEEHQHSSTSDSSDIVDKPKLLSSSPCPSLPPPPSPFRRTRSGRLLSRAQSTISICALLVCLTLLVFTLSTFDPPSPSVPASASFSRRFLPERQPSQRHRQQSQPLLTPTPQNDRAPSSFWSFPTFFWRAKPKNGGSKSQFALQGMGTLYRRGTRARGNAYDFSVTVNFKMIKNPFEYNFLSWEIKKPCFFLSEFVGVLQIKRRFLLLRFLFFIHFR